MWDEEELLRNIDNYFKNTSREKIIEDLKEACGGEEKFKEIFEGENIMIIKECLLITDEDVSRLDSLIETLDIQIGSLWNLIGNTSDEKLKNILKNLSITCAELNKYKSS